MGTSIQLIQGSPEWHVHRQGHCNASETAAVMGLSPWQTPYQLWLIKTGRASQAVSAPMIRGTQLEPLAREAYEALTGSVMQPLVMADGKYSASLDGITFAGDLILEIKCPFKGRESELWKEAAAGVLPIHYQLQVQHQLMVTQADHAHVYVFDGKEGILLMQRPEPEQWQAIRDAWEDFMERVALDRAPHLTDRDTLQRDDTVWQEASREYIRMKSQMDEAQTALDGAKERLIQLCRHPSESGAGLTVTRYWKSGTVDYKKALGSTGTELEAFRGPSREEVRISLEKGR